MTLVRESVANLLLAKRICIVWQMLQLVLSSFLPTILSCHTIRVTYGELFAVSSISPIAVAMVGISSHYCSYGRDKLLLL